MHTGGSLFCITVDKMAFRDYAQNVAGRQFAPTIPLRPLQCAQDCLRRHGRIVMGHMYAYRPAIP